MALTLLAANNAQSVLAAGISASATSLTLNTGTGALFPSPVSGTSFFKLTLIDAATGSLTEIVHVTARAGDVFTIQRGQEGTVPRAWSANDIAANMLTAGSLQLYAQKDQNGADIPQPDWFVRNVGAGRAFSGTVSIGGGGDWTTAEFIAWLELQGAFNHPYWMCKGSWSYGANRTITDTGCGNIHLAGAVVEVMGVRGAMTIRVTTPTSSMSGVVNAQFTYVNHGEGYPATWRRDFNTANKPTSEDVGALPKTGGEISGDLDVKGITSTKALYTSKLFTQRSEVPFEFGLANQVTGPQYWDIHTTYPEIYYDYRVAFHSNANRIDLLHKSGYAGLNLGGLALRAMQIDNVGRVDGNALISHFDSSGKLVMNYGYYQDGFSINFYDANGAWQSNPFFVGRNGNASVSGNLSGGRVYEGGIRVYSPNNPQPVDLSPYATMSWVLQNFVQNIRVSAPQERKFWDGKGWSDNDSAFATAIWMVGGSSNVGGLYVRYVQKNINGTWINVTE